MEGGVELLVTSPNGESVVRFDDSEVVWIGRSSRCQIRLADETSQISRFHARLSRDHRGWVLLDQSQTGTFLNGARLESEVDHPLVTGDEIAVGETTFLVTRLGDRVHVSDSFRLTIAPVDFARLDTKLVLASAMDLPRIFGDSDTEGEVYERACEYLVKALSPAVTSVYVVAAGQAGNVVLARRSPPGEDIPLLSRRVVRAACDAEDSVVFLHQRHAGGLDATVMPEVRAVGACLLELSPDGDPILIYTVGRRAIADGGEMIADYLKLVATLTRQHVETVRRIGLTKYFSPRVVELLMQPGGRAQAEGPPRITTATSMFFDLRGFSFSTEASAGDLLPLHRELTKVMDIVTEEVFRTGGTVIDYQGDGCFAAWGVPFEQEDQHEAAVRCAMAVLERLGSANLSLGSRERGICGMGIASGEVLAGTVASSSHFKYGLLGPSVNLASRLESLTKPNRLNAGILFPDEIMKAVRRAGIPTVRVARVRPDGMHDVLDVHTVCPADSPLARPEVAEIWHGYLEDLEGLRDPEGRDALVARLEDIEGAEARMSWLRDRAARLADPAELAAWRGVVSYGKP